MLGKKFTCLCTGLLCCAMTLSWSSQRAAADESTKIQAPALTEVTDSQIAFQDESEKQLDYIYANFQAREIDEAIQMLGTADTETLFTYFTSLTPDEGDPRGPGVGNDTCATGTALTIGGPSVVADNTNAGTDVIPSGTCTTSAPFRGIWYTVVGDGTTLTVSTCLPGTVFDTKVQVFCDCFDYTCVGGNDDASPSDIPNCGVAGLNRKSRFSWCAALGQTYYIHVGGFSNTTFGSIETIVTSNGVTGCTPLSCTPPVRRCCYADGIAGACQNLTAGNCAAQSFGQWGTSGQTCTTVCTSGRCCYQTAGVAQCAATSQAQCNAFGGVWTSGSTCATACPVGRCCYNGNTQCQDVTQAVCTFLAGNWTTGLTCAANPCPVNDTCATAITVNCGDTVNGDNRGAASDYGNVSVPCTGFTQAGPDLVYKINIPNNAQITATMTPGTPTFDASIYVVTNCADINGTCVDGEDNGNPEVAQWNATANTDYFIICDKFGSGGGGPFSLAITCVVGGACCSYDGAGLLIGCTDVLGAANCAAVGQVYQGDGSACASVTCGGACCKLDGTCDQRVDAAACQAVGGTFYAASTCATTCGGGCCVAGVCQLVVSEQACTALSGQFRGRGSDCTAPCPPQNDTCANGTPIACGATVSGSLSAATNNYDPTSAGCTGFAAVGPDVVYTLTLPTAASVTVSLDPNPGPWDASVYVATTCTELPGTIVCIAGADDLASSASPETFTFAAAASTTYYIIADKFGATAANLTYDLIITCELPGACCLPDTTCQDVAGAGACTTLGGTYLGEGTTCATSNCATGACCHADGTCTDGALQSECGLADDVFTSGATCATVACSGRCCYLEFGFLEVCANTNQPACLALSGQWTANLNCTSDPCPIGKCCNDPGTGPQCNDYTEVHCNFLGGVWTAGVLCQPGDCLPAANDTCETAIAISCGSVVNGDLTTANNNYDPTSTGCTGFAAIGPDVVYSFSTPIARNVTILMDPSPEFDASLYVVTDCNNLLTCVAGADDNVLTPGDETLTFAAAANTTYYVIADKFGTLAAGFGPFTLSVTCPIDPCESCPGDLDGNGRLDGRDVQAFTDCFVASIGGIPPAGCGCADMDGSGTVDIFDVDDFANRLTDILNKFCGDGLGRCCINNGASCQSNVTLYECNDLGGTFAAGLNCTANPCPVLPDTCAQAQALTLGVETIGNNTTATDDLTGTCGVSSPNQALWYSIVGTGNTMTASTEGANTLFTPSNDTLLQVWCGTSCNELVCVGGDDDAGVTPALSSRFSWCSTAGQIYWIAVGGFSTNVGQFGLTVTDDGLVCSPAAPCTPPLGRCCYLDGGLAACADNTQGQCTTLGGQWTVALTCGANPCPVGRCCSNGGASCTDNTQLECNAIGGTWATGVDCFNNPCSGNETCATAAVINCGDTVNNTLSGAVNDYNQLSGNACTGYSSGGPDLVYSLTPTQNGVVTVDMTGITFDGSLYVVTDCNTLSPCVGGSDACCGGASEQVIFSGVANTTYYIIVDAFTTAPANGAFTLSITCDTGGGGACCSPNGVCTEVAGAALCPAGSTYTEGETCGTVTCDSCVNCTDGEFEACPLDPDTLNGGCNSIPEVFSTINCNDTVCGTSGTFLSGGNDTRDTDWYQLTLPSASILTWAVTADFDVLIGIIDGNAGCAGVTGFLVFQTQTACTPAGVNATLSAGTYYLFVAPSVFTGFDCADGPWTYTGNVSCVPVGANGACCTAGVCTDAPDQATCELGGGVFQGLATDCGSVTCPAANDTCAGATVIGSLPYSTSGTTVGYSNNYDEACPYTGSLSADVAYSYTPLANETISVNLCDSDNDTKTYIYANACGTGNLVAGACNDDACQGTGLCGGGLYCSQLTSVSLTGGVTYYIIVDGYGSLNGAYILNVTTP